MSKYKRIFLDPGHGGVDSGAYNSKVGIKESMVALQVCRQIKKIIKAENKKAKKQKKSKLIRKHKMSRRVDKFVELNTRWKMANAWKADLSLCIHCNSCDVESVRGSEVFYYHSNSKELAQKISKGLSHDFHITNRGAKKYPWAMTKYPNMAAVLVEIDFISNNSFAKSCKNKKFIKQIAQSIYKSIMEVEKR